MSSTRLNGIRPLPAFADSNRDRDALAGTCLVELPLDFNIHLRGAQARIAGHPSL